MVAPSCDRICHLHELKLSHSSSYGCWVGVCMWASDLAQDDQGSDPRSILWLKEAQFSQQRRWWGCQARWCGGLVGTEGALRGSEEEEYGQGGAWVLRVEAGELASLVGRWEVVKTLKQQPSGWRGEDSSPNYLFRRLLGHLPDFWPGRLCCSCFWLNVLFLLNIL